MWLLQDFDAADTAQLSDHPDHQHRVEALEKHFRENPSVFVTFSSDDRIARPFVVPANAPMTFMR